MELELATRGVSERRWAARWETLPAHHEARLEVERQRLSEDQARRRSGRRWRRRRRP